MLGGKNIMCYYSGTDNETITSLATTISDSGGAVCALSSNASSSTVISGKSEKGWKFSADISNMTAINSYSNGKCKL